MRLSVNETLLKSRVSRLKINIFGQTNKKELRFFFALKIYILSFYLVIERWFSRHILFFIKKAPLRGL